MITIFKLKPTYGQF